MQALSLITCRIFLRANIYRVQPFCNLYLGIYSWLAKDNLQEQKIMNEICFQDYHNKSKLKY
ncbi:hypothetical protein H1P_70011 [Hyella patelloides LEGE 07179]|uniref:Uncharacterized protein n=1 Tax=Hyella patelloides LEGE 07179 TaxID=945734 RepID=A0A563W360_9CYAN|nr:hypothetical protein H1P_70011 [Hyella patelloides LEGE 07179]